jgi:hypothetical protein
LGLFIWSELAMTDYFDLPGTSANLLLATRCFGRATAFPHVLMQRVLAALTDISYADVLQDLYSRQLIVAEGKGAFDISRQGWDWLGYRQVPSPIWLAAIKALVETVPASREADDHETLDLLVIHAAALANAFYDRDKQIYLHLMGLSVECLIHLGRLDEAQHRLDRLQSLADEMKDDE